MMSTSSLSLVKMIRPLAFPGGVIIALALGGCAGVAPPYQATNDNVRIAQTLPNGPVSLGDFKAQSENLNHLSIRGGSYASPYHDSYAEYLKESLQRELEAAGKLDAKSSVIITGELLANELDASMGTGSAHVSARIIVKRDGRITFNKIVNGDNKWDSSFIGGVAIPLARQHYADTVKKLIANLFADPEFKNAL